jgi:hypothetical protein
LKSRLFANGRRHASASDGKTLDFQSSALPTELPSRFARENMRNNNQLHNHDRMTSAGH